MSSIHLLDTHEIAGACGCTDGGDTNDVVDHDCFEMCMDAYTVYANVAYTIDEPSFTNSMSTSFGA